MLNHVNIENILFLDIETVPQQYKFENLDDQVQYLWNNKTRFLQERESLSAEEIYERAGIYSEFGKIICITCGFIVQKNGEKTIRLRSFASDDEKKLLHDFANMLDGHFSSPQHLLCAHNGKEFDFPYIARRTLINGLKLPKSLDIAGKKPWEIAHLDTMELWKFGDYKHYTSLELLAHIFGIPTPKDDISGADVGRVYWEEKDLDRIVEYCQKDVVTTIQLFLKYKGQSLIDEENVIVT